MAGICNTAEIYFAVHLSKHPVRRGSAGLARARDGRSIFAVIAPGGPGWFSLGVFRNFADVCGGEIAHMKVVSMREKCKARSFDFIIAHSETISIKYLVNGMEFSGKIIGNTLS